MEKKLPEGFVLDPPPGPGPRITNLPEGFVLDPAPTPPGPASQGAVADTLSAFNDTLTFGAYPWLLETLGIRPGEQDRIARMRQENPVASVVGDLGGYVVPGMAASSAVSKAIPALARNTIARVGAREAVAGAGLEATEQVARGALRGDPFGEFDPTMVGLSGITGGVLGVGTAGLSRINPIERMRAAGGDLTDVDKEAAAQFMDVSNGVGVPVNVMEAVSHSAGPRAARLEGQYNAATSRPGGGREAHSFDAIRSPIIRETGREMVSELGGGVSPQTVSDTAEGVFRNIREAANADAAPFYARADQRRLPPTWVPRHDYIDDAMRRMNTGEGASGMNFDMGQRYTQATGRPAPVPHNSFMYLDAVRREMQDEIGREMAKPSPRNNYIEGIQAQLERMTRVMDTASPDYAQARSIFEQGAQRADDLRAGPLGSFENGGGTAESQASTLFGVSTGADAANSSAAIAALGDTNPDVPRGMLANYIDSAVSSDVVRPDVFGTSLFPNQHSAGLIEDILGPGGSPQITTRLDAARAVKPHQARNDSQLGGLNFGNKINDFLFGVGSGPAVRNMQDPAFVKQLGRTGPTHEAAQAAMRSVNQATDLDELLAQIMGLRANALN